MFTSAGGRSSWAVASGSEGGGFSCTPLKTARAVPTACCLAGRLRRYPPLVARGLMWTALLLLTACASQPVFSGIDCGTTVGANYDLQARECVWSAYSSGKAVRWQVRAVRRSSGWSSRVM